MEPTFCRSRSQELADEQQNLHAVKESSTDARRVTAIRALLGDRLEILVGVDDVIVEGIGVGATGWIAGLGKCVASRIGGPVQPGDGMANAKRRRAVSLVSAVAALDTVPKFVQLIKLVQAEAGDGQRARASAATGIDGANATGFADDSRCLRTRPATGKQQTVPA